MMPPRSHLAILACLLAIAPTVFGASAAFRPEISVSVTWQPIPLNGYKSWSLFLVCNPQWAKPQEAPRLRELYRQFLEFGQAIGDTHLAVWLLASRSGPTRVDTARSVRFCENLNLPLADGPYVVVTGRYPGAALTEQPDTFVSDLGNQLVVSLNGLDAEETTHLLETLAKQLEANDLQQRAVDSEAFWQALRLPFESASDPVLRRVSATFKTSYFSTAIAQPSAALVTAAPPSAGAIGSGSTWTAAKADRTPVRLTAFVVGRTGLIFDAGKGSYKGTFAVALQNLDDSLDRGILHDAVTIAVNAAGASAFNPTPVKLARLSEWNDVEVWVTDPPSKKYRVSVSAGPNDPGNFLELDVSRPRAALRAASTRILGWGLGTTQLYVTSRGNGGAWVQLSTDNGSLDPASIQLDRAGNAVTTLRSDVSGSTSIAVDPSLWAAEPVMITFRAPYYFLLAAILGGLLGAFLRGRGRRKWVRALAIGIGTALLMTVGQAVGFNAWIATALGSNTLATSGEAVVFFLGAIAALIGVSVLLRPEAKTH